MATLKDQNEVLHRDNTKLTKEVERLMKLNTVLTTDRDNLTTRANDLSDQNENRSETIIRQRKELVEAQQEAATLKAKNEELEDRHERQARIIEKMRNQIESLQTMCHTLEKIIRDALRR